MKRIKLINNRINSIRDENREHRSVFISYASEDVDYANGIRVHLESLGIDVWYGPTTIDVGTVWREEIKAGVKNASAFIPLFTDSYLLSDVCRDELQRFLIRVDDPKDTKLRIYPIVRKLSEKRKMSEVFRDVTEKYQYIDFHPRATDALTSLTMSVQAHVAQSRNLQRRPGESAR